MSAWEILFLLAWGASCFVVGLLERRHRPAAPRVVHLFRWCPVHGYERREVVQ